MFFSIIFGNCKRGRDVATLNRISVKSKKIATDTTTGVFSNSIIDKNVYTKSSQSFVYYFTIQ